MDINILKEEDFDGILWDANDDVDDDDDDDDDNNKVLSTEISNGQQQETVSNKNETQKQGLRASSISNQNDQHSRLLNIDCSVPTLPLPSSNLDLSTQRAFPTIDMEDTLEHPFLNSFVSTLAEKSSSQDAPNNVLNASTGLPIFPSTSSSNDGTNTTLNNSQNLDGISSAQARGTLATLMNGDFENMLLPPNYLTSWEPNQSATQQNYFAIGNKNVSPNVPQHRQQGNKAPSQPTLSGNNKWSLMHGQNTSPVSHANLTSNAVANPLRGFTSQPQQNQNKRPSSQTKSHNVSDNETVTKRVVEVKTKSKRAGSQNKKQKQSNNGKAQVPPFFLFDAPVELRHNFMKAQQSQNMPASIQDSNSFHYGLAKNSFQPLIKYKDNKVQSLSMLHPVDDICNPHGKKVELLDARQKKSKRGNDRNEREQQRAQKITELIDKLRLTMVQNGWKVEMKSKYQILST